MSSIASFLTAFLTVIGIGATAMGFSPKEGGLGVTVLGLAMITGAWFWARATSGASSVNGIGTGFFGEVQTPQGLIMTKWITLFIPILPVRSMIVLNSQAGRSDFMTTNTSYSVVKLPGLGLWWPSVGKTILWTLLVVVVFAVVMAIVTSRSK